MNSSASRIAVMGGSYGNVPALQACLEHADAQGCDLRIFLGDAIGCCGHSDETLDLIRERFDVVIAGNHEQQAASGALTCGCGYASAEDEKWGCEAFRLALESLSDSNRDWLGKWPDLQAQDTVIGRLLLCHGSPDQTNEFLYESELDNDRLEQWLEQYDAVGLLCTHTGLPWVRELTSGRFAANVGVIGKPDHDGDPAVHYAIVANAGGQQPSPIIQRVAYDHQRWIAQLESETVPPILVQPLKTGRWTTGVNSLPDTERKRLDDRFAASALGDH